MIVPEWAEKGHLLPAFEKLASELTQQAEKKNADYGSSVGFHGARGIVPRLSDKFVRLNTLVWENQAANYESALDSAKDLASYAILLAIALQWEQEHVGTDAGQGVAASFSEPRFISLRPNEAVCVDPLCFRYRIPHVQGKDCR